MRIRKIIIFSSILMTLLYIFSISINANDDIASSYNLIDKLSDVIKIHKNKYKKLDDYHLLNIEENVIYTEGLSQSYYNNLFNKKSNYKIDGTCSIISSTISSIYYLNLCNKLYNYKINIDNYNIFKNCLNIAKNNKYFPYEVNGSYYEGTYSGCVGNIVEELLNYYNINIKWHIHSSNILDRIINETNMNKITSIGILNHDLVGCGYVKINYSYKKNNIRIKNSDYYYVLLSGWTNSNCNINSNRLYKDYAFDYLDINKRIDYVICYS